MEANTRAARVTVRPIDVGSLGAYSVAATSGTIAAGAVANAPVFSFRWGDATRVCLVRKVSVAMASLATGFAAGIGQLGFIIARGFSSSDSGGIVLTLTGNNAKRRTSFGSTLVTDSRISSTGALTAGTRTLDTNDASLLQFAVGTATNTVMLATMPIWSPDWAGDWPLVLVQNEGFIIRATVPATGTWQVQVCVEWCETAAF